MNQAHIHLLITHLPIFGTLLGGLVLLHALRKKSKDTEVASYNIFILSSIGAAIAYLTGEGAEEAVEHLPGVMESAIEEHEEFAMFALICTIALGAISILGIVLNSRNEPYARRVSTVVLVLAVLSFIVAARTGYLGGQIRHTEVSNATVNSQTESAQPNESGEEEDDD